MKKPTKFEVILVSVLGVILLCAASPIKDLILQSDMDAAGFAITNVGSSTNLTSAATLGQVQTNISNASTNYATFEQGATADTALQSGASYTNISGLGTAATNAATAFATAAEGDLAESAAQLDFISSPPATSTSTGTTGQLIYAGNYLYICIATDTWLRAQLLTW